jgi:hypothetical protein
MRWLVAVLLVLSLSGCVCTPPSDGVTPQPTTTLLTTITAPDTPVQALTAKEGFESANRKVLSLRPDAVFVGVSGSVEGSGGSTQWEYQYDSLKGKKGYAVEASTGEIRERPYSFRAPLGPSWADSDKAAALCNVETGEFSLEVQDGKPVWTVIAEEKTCVVDAASGTLQGGDE